MMDCTRQRKWAGTKSFQNSKISDEIFPDLLHLLFILDGKNDIYIPKLSITFHLYADL